VFDTLITLPLHSPTFLNHLLALMKAIEQKRSPIGIERTHALKMTNAASGPSLPGEGRGSLGRLRNAHNKYVA